MLAQILGPDGIVIAVVLMIVLFFGARKIRGLAHSLGSAQGEFKKGVAQGHEEILIAVVATRRSENNLPPEAVPVVTYVDVDQQVD